MSSVLKKIGYLGGLVVAGAAGWYLSEYQNRPEVSADADYLAVVNGQGIDKDWFMAQMKLRGGLKPGQFQSIEQKKALLDFLINEEIVFQKAMTHGVQDDPTVNQLYRKTVIDKFLKETLNHKLQEVKVGDSVLEAHFENNQAAYNKPARRRAAMIKVGFSDQDDEAAKVEKRERIENVLTQVENLDAGTMHFGELARAHSDDRASMYQGGVIGWFINHPSREYKWDQALIDALFELAKPGDVSEVIETEDGYYLIRLVSAENVKEKTFAQVKKGIKNQLLQEKRKEIKTQFMDELIASADVDVNDQILASIPALSGAATDDAKQPPAMPAVGGAK